ncbi:hypothetical protein BDW02DRAFT_603512 [Decorospora gaudefroyi]|uniref:Uncharacterized protein n=1 Tax=Decorospora gaudefroyi TaxID=184978 RepID=A0A6A5JXK9_9PLEO|nr:hypothetical protein BDW02DRAFT_603512 [Decorospora gaudefroyi]
MFTLAAPMVWVWAVDRIRERMSDPFRRRRDIEGRIAKKYLNIDPLRNRRPPVDSIWARQREYASRMTKPPRAITADQILGNDKASFFRGIVLQSYGSSQLLTVAPAHFRPGKQKITSIAEEQFISPWDVEHSPNPVIFPWLQKCASKGSSGERSESLQAMAKAISPAPQAGFLADAPCPSADEPSSESPTQYTSSGPKSDKSSETPETRQQIQVGSPRDAESSIASSPAGQASSPLQCNTCQTTYKSPGQLK